MPRADSDVHVNLRDVHEAEPNIIRSETVYRSSEVLGYESMLTQCSSALACSSA